MATVFIWPACLRRLMANVPSVYHMSEVTTFKMSYVLHKFYNTTRGRRGLLADDVNSLGHSDVPRVFKLVPGKRNPQTIILNIRFFSSNYRAKCKVATSSTAKSLKISPSTSDIPSFPPHDKTHHALTDFVLGNSLAVPY